ncbi:Drosomycin [Frankliniella fusca]|uniref:Drosomycin n=1 Tax=Frankliniella fusca TaxID=407009 RepID=A0AAE1HRJ0_9NEOP|nr:Drosomycin [Frankliniella fusca]
MTHPSARRRALVLSLAGVCLLLEGVLVESEARYVSTQDPRPHKGKCVEGPGGPAACRKVCAEEEGSGGHCSPEGECICSGAYKTSRVSTVGTEGPSATTPAEEGQGRRPSVTAAAAAAPGARTAAAAAAGRAASTGRGGSGASASPRGAPAPTRTPAGAHRTGSPSKSLTPTHSHSTASDCRVEGRWGEDHGGQRRVVDGRTEKEIDNGSAERVGDRDGRYHHNNRVLRDIYRTWRQLHDIFRHLHDIFRHLHDTCRIWRHLYDIFRHRHDTYRICGHRQLLGGAHDVADSSDGSGGGHGRGSSSRTDQQCGGRFFLGYHEGGP